MSFDEIPEDKQLSFPFEECGADNIVKNKEAAAKYIERLETAILETIEENLHLADGDACTLIKLKRAINYTY